MIPYIVISIEKEEVISSDDEDISIESEGEVKPAILLLSSLFELLIALSFSNVST